MNCQLSSEIVKSSVPRNLSPGFVQRGRDSHEPERAQLPDVFLHILVVQPGGPPVERRREVVCQPMTGSFGVYAVGKLFGLSVDGRFGLHPQEVYPKLRHLSVPLFRRESPLRGPEESRNDLPANGANSMARLIAHLVPPWYR